MFNLNHSRTLLLLKSSASKSAALHLNSHHLKALPYKVHMMSTSNNGGPPKEEEEA
jgi:hypothetical protein